MTPRFSLALVAGSCVILAACTDPAAYGTANRTTDGAIAGGVVGAAAGLLVDGDNQLRNAALGAAAGAAAGGFIGNRLDRQEAALRESVGDDRIQIENTGSELIVTMPQDILFAVDSSDLDPAVVGDLQAVAGNLNQYPDGTVEVLGHTDNTGSASYNLELSQRRAQSVANVLTAAGVPASRLQTTGRGDDAPRASNLTEDGQALNRRVEIVIRPEAV